MCGITGIFAFNLVGKFNKIHVTHATMAMEKRGPDFQDIYLDEWIGLGHRRLSIIDTREVANQPMWDEGKRYCIVFNGEIFNYRQLREELAAKGVSFFTEGDTEVLLKLYIDQKEKALPKLNGFFSFCIYDRQEQTLFLARDRYGIKPLLYTFDEDKFIFASEMKSMMRYGLERTLDYASLLTYLQLNYIPAPHSIFPGIKKLLPGHYITVRRQTMDIRSYYSIPYKDTDIDYAIGYTDAQRKLAELLETSVQRRLVADVPLGAFLSGDIDSSVVVALASKHKPGLHTFSMGCRDEKFDETEYANLAAKHFRTHHTVFALTHDDLFAHVNDILNYIDEPFADPSAIAMYILSKETRRHATVALSGDGADELLAGYDNHTAFHRTLHKGWKEHTVEALHPLWMMLSRSRFNRLTDTPRQLARFSSGMKASARDRYWKWAGFARESEATALLAPSVREHIEEYTGRKAKLLVHLPEKETINDILLTDMHLVLANNMLTKVDSMSMANSLEVRVPFLDYEVVNFLFTLPAAYKINTTMRKRLLQDAFRNILPAQLYNRPKKRFEVPLLKWFKREMKSAITHDLLSESLIRDQGVFDYAEIQKLLRQLFSSNPGEVHARIWNLIVFQSWWKKLFRA